jgi:hypothetical protein
VLTLAEAGRFSEQPATVVHRAMRQGELTVFSMPPPVFLRRDVAAWIEELHLKKCRAARREGEFTKLLENGYLQVRGALSDQEVSVLRTASDSLLQMTPCPQDPRFIFRPGTGAAGAVLERVLDVQDLQPAFRRMFRNELLCAVGGAVIGQSFLVYNTSLVVKLPRVGVSIWIHRDPTWTTRSLPDPVLTVAFYLDDSDEANGAVSFMPRTHRPRDGRSSPLPADERAWWSEAACVRAAAGDAVVHNLGVIHGSRPNPSPLLRRTLYYSLMSVREARLSGRWSEEWIADRQHLLYKAGERGDA